MKKKISIQNVSIQIPRFNPIDNSFKNKFLRGKSIKEYSTILNDINLEINDGDRIGLYGPNGSGKTSLLRLICGSYKPSVGKISVDGKIHSMIDINLGFDMEASGIDNIKLRLALLNFSDYSNHLIKKIISFSGLADKIYDPIRTFSSGMLMRLSFSIITSIKPDILILDEWLSVGDQEFSAKVEKRMKTYVNSSSILVIASHNLNLLENVCNKLVFLENGAIVKSKLI
jgi:lipopolysaccharide transport system ATP-binding protein